MRIDAIPRTSLFSTDGASRRRRRPVSPEKDRALSGNGWRQGRDPVQRYLRIITSIVVVGIFVYLAITEEGRDDILVMALALGAGLLLLGYEGVIRLPYLNGGRKDDDER